MHYKDLIISTKTYSTYHESQPLRYHLGQKSRSLFGQVDFVATRAET